MNEKEKLTIGIVEELQKCTLEEYAEIKPILLSASAEKPALLSFLGKVFAFVEKSRPRLLETKSNI